MRVPKVTVFGDSFYGRFRPAGPCAYTYVGLRVFSALSLARNDVESTQMKALYQRSLDQGKDYDGRIGFGKERFSFGSGSWVPPTIVKEPGKAMPAGIEDATSTK